MHNIYSKAFGQALRKSRLRARLSQEKLADTAGLTRAHISLLERGKRSPTLDTVMAICEAISIVLEEFSELFTYELSLLRAKQNAKNQLQP